VVSLPRNEVVSLGGISKLLKKKNQAAHALRLGASSLHHSKTPLGDFFRRKRSKNGPATAIIATATKMAIMIYEMMKNKTPYKPEKMIQNQEKYKLRLIRRLEEKLSLLKAA